MAKRPSKAAPGKPKRRQGVAAREERFCREYLVDLNGAAAAIRAGFAANSARQRAYELLAREDIQAKVAEFEAQRAERTEITADMVLQRLWMIATADPNEISQFRRNACRYCHGINHAYQWSDRNEFDTAVRTAIDKSRTPPDDAGGYGFDINAAPAPDCPRCNGNGHGYTYIADTRNLSPAAALLYAGMKETRDGIEVKTHDQMAALEKVARHLGMYKEKVEHSGKIEVEKLTDDELEARIAAYERGGKEDGPET